MIFNVSSGTFLRKHRYRGFAKTDVLHMSWVSMSSGNPRTHQSHNKANTVSEITVNAKSRWKQIGQLVFSFLSTPCHMQILFVTPQFNAPVCNASLPTFLLHNAPDIWLKTFGRRHGAAYCQAAQARRCGQPA